LSPTEVAQWLIEHPWLASVPTGIWYLPRIARTVASVIRGEIRDRWLRAKGVPASERRKLAVDAVRRDLESK
jgi:hypothetical protein